MRITSCVLGLAACLLGHLTAAEADVSKAWAAAKDNLPANTMLVVAIDVGAIYKSALFPRVLDAVKNIDREFSEAHTMMKTACGWDPLSVVEGVVLAGDPKTDGGIAFVQLSIDRTKASACLESAAKAMKKNKTITVKQDGVYTVAKKGDGDRDSLYFPWVAPNVVAISIGADKKAMVDAWFNQKGFGKSMVSGLLGKLDSKATVSGAFASDKAVDSWIPVNKGYGNWTLAGGKVTGSLVITGIDAKSATQLSDELNKDLKKGMTRDRTPASIKKIMSTISITVSGMDITVKGTATEKELGDAVNESFMKKKSEGSDASGSRTPDPDMAAALIKMDAFSKSMCTCKDKACADKVNADMTKWGTEMAKKATKGGTPSADQMKKANDVMTRYTECLTKLMSASQPKVEPKPEDQYKMKKN